SGVWLSDWSGAYCVGHESKLKTTRDSPGSSVRSCSSEFVGMWRNCTVVPMRRSERSISRGSPTVPATGRSSPNGLPNGEAGPPESERDAAGAGADDGGDADMRAQLE